MSQLKIVPNLLSSKVGHVGNEAAPPALRMAVGGAGLEAGRACAHRDWPAGVTLSRGRLPSIRAPAAALRRLPGAGCAGRARRADGCGVSGAAGGGSEQRAGRAWRVPCLPAWWTAAPGKSRRRPPRPGSKHLPRCPPLSPLRRARWGAWRQEPPSPFAAHLALRRAGAPWPLQHPCTGCLRAHRR